MHDWKLNPHCDGHLKKHSVWHIVQLARNKRILLVSKQGSPKGILFIIGSLTLTLTANSIKQSLACRLFSKKMRQTPVRTPWNLFPSLEGFKNRHMLLLNHPEHVKPVGFNKALQGPFSSSEKFIPDSGRLLQSINCTLTGYSAPFSRSYGSLKN